MKVTLNGEGRDLPEGATVATLLQELKLLPRQVAVEVNRRLLRSEKYGNLLKEGDSIEIVTFVGGG